ncbi:50S ribosomal protein L11 methyltransferase [Flavobacteriales bacterium]|nr:50S ribosomal protein L11 methyltransferase [Flavobacteriales bacterium]
MDYLEFIFDISACKEEKVDLLVAHLYGFGFDSFEHKKKLLSAFILESQFSLQSLKKKILNKIDIELLEIRKLENKNWNAIWESSFDPVVIQNQCCIRAPFHSKKPKIKFDILVTPKMSFGTGHHETTALMIEAILFLNIESKKVLDVGCGTAVLSVLANKKGASKVVAIDIDKNCYENSLENIKNNNSVMVDVFCENIFKINMSNFDIVLANINKNVLLNEMSEYFSKLNNGGVLILSGFFESDFDDIDSCANECGFKLNARKEKNKWQCLVYEK